MGHGIEEAPDIRVKHPVHLSPENAGVESVQRIVLAAPRPESIGEPEEVFLVDCFENRRDRLLDDFVLQAQNAQRPFRAIRLRNVGSSGRTRSVTAPVHLVVQFLQLLFEVLSVGLPRHAVDARRGVPFKRKVAQLQEIDGDVMQQRSEPYTLALSRRSAHGDESVRRGIPAQCPGRGRLAAVPLGRGPSLHGLRRGQALFVRPLLGYYDPVRILIRVHVHRSAVAFMNRPGLPARARMRLPRFRAKNFSTCTRSQTARGSSHASHSPWDDVAFSSSERDRHLGIRPVSQLNTWPVVSPVNASRRPSRDAAHHSGSGWLARPSPWGTFTSYSLPASWRTPRWVSSVVSRASRASPLVTQHRTRLVPIGR